MTRLAEKYQKTVVPELIKEFGYTNPHQVPKLVKVVVNAGVGRAVSDSKHLEHAIATLRKITAQQPVETVAKKSISTFKLRDGNKIGAAATLRGDRMYDFLDRLVSVTLPRIRDFRGISDTAFDAQGNYSLGLNDHSIFAEISFDEAGVSHGLQVNIVTTAKTAAEGKRLLELMGFPFRRIT
jgi:large subunit ribosomal protein L5